MIQRIQSIYLLIAGILLIITLCLPLGAFIGAGGNVLGVLKALGVESTGGFSYTWGVFFILLLSVIIAFSSIFLYRNRMLQVRMTVFNSILILGFYAVFVVFMLVLKKTSEAAHYQIGWALAFPAISIIFNYLAFRAIYRDELMVRAADRLR